MIKLIALMLFMSSVQAFAFPRPLAPLMVHPGAAESGYHFDGIVALNDCSGSIIRFEDSQPTEPAVVLTNGHCYEGGMPDFRTFVYNKTSNRAFGVLNDQGDHIGTVRAAMVMYSTMTGTDITLYKLQETYQDIATKYNSHAFLLASTHPTAGTPIQVISGYWQRGYTCAVDGFAGLLKEGQWTMQDSVRYTMPGCEVIGGTSGSPVVPVGTHTVIAVNNTVNEGGQKCTEDNPCEEDQSGNVTRVQKGQAYAQETYLIYSCLDSKHNVNLATPGCQLFH